MLIARTFIKLFTIYVLGAIHESPFRTVVDACPYKICGIFDILSVGEDIILPLLIKISLRFARDAEDVVPYRF